MWRGAGFTKQGAVLCLFLFFFVCLWAWFFNAASVSPAIVSLLYCLGSTICGAGLGYLLACLLVPYTGIANIVEKRERGLARLPCVSRNTGLNRAHTGWLSNAIRPSLPSPPPPSSCAPAAFLCSFSLRSYHGLGLFLFFCFELGEYQIAILMGCAVLPHLRQMVEIVEHGLVDEQQKVRGRALLCCSTQHTTMPHAEKEKHADLTGTGIVESTRQVEVGGCERRKAKGETFRQPALCSLFSSLI